MQYWIFFHPGTGGDGFVNLLEHADNMHCANGEQPVTWKIHKVFSDSVKFFGAQWCGAPNIPQNQPFRNLGFDFSVPLADSYVKLINQNLNTVIPAHYVYFGEITRCPWRDLVEKDQIKIHLYSNNIEKIIQNKIKKLQLSDSDFDLKHELKVAKTSIRHAFQTHNVYNCHIDIDRAQNDWEYLNSCLIKLDIHLDKKYYDEYLLIKDAKYIPT